MKRLGFTTSLVLLSVYVVHTVWGKLAAVGLVAMPFSLGEVGEFLVVLGAMLAFVVGLYAVESERSSDAGPKSC